MEIKEFPIHTQIGTFNNGQDIDAWLSAQTSEYYPQEYCATIKSHSYIYNDFVEEQLLRYKYLREFGIVSYSNVFDELPAVWIDTLTLMDAEIKKATEAKRSLNA